MPPRPDPFIPPPAIVPFLIILQLFFSPSRSGLLPPRGVPPWELLRGSQPSPITGMLSAGFCPATGLKPSELNVFLGASQSSQASIGSQQNLHMHLTTQSNMRQLPLTIRKEMMLRNKQRDTSVPEIKKLNEKLIM